MEIIFIHGQNYTYSIQRQARKTLQLQILANNALLIKAPKNLASNDIISFINKKADWISRNNFLLNNNLNKENQPLSIPEKLLPFMGKQYHLNITNTLCKPFIKLTSNELRINLYVHSNNELPNIIKSWYLKQASIILAQKTEYWARKVDTTFNRIAIKDQKTRWGSCSSLGNINYNWRIIMAPEATIDYLVIHEVSHRIFLNHSKNFWDLVKLHCPNYSIHKLWLKEHGHNLLNFSLS